MGSTASGKEGRRNRQTLVGLSKVWGKWFHGSPEPLEDSASSRVGHPLTAVVVPIRQRPQPITRHHIIPVLYIVFLHHRFYYYVFNRKGTEHRDQKFCQHESPRGQRQQRLRAYIYKQQPFIAKSLNKTPFITLNPL